MLAGCSSDDGDDDGDDMDTGNETVVGDADGSTVPDAFETTDNTLDTTGNGIIDIYDAAEDGSNDTNGNQVADEFEVAITGGTDANSDGVDDDALAALDGDGDGDGEGEGESESESESEGESEGEGEGEGEGENTPPGDGIGTGPLNPVALEGDAGNVTFSWDGFNLSGTVTTNPDVGASSAALIRGIAASNDPGTQLIELSGSGPDFPYPSGLSADQSAPIAAAMGAGNLFVRVQTAAGPVDSFQLLPPSNAVVSTYSALTSADSSVTSMGDAFMNVNTVTGDYSFYLSVNITDEDEDGNPITLSAAHVHSGSADGPVIIPLSDTGSGTEFSSIGTMNEEQLAVITTNNGWFNVHLNDGTTPGPSLLSGQISSPDF